MAALIRGLRVDVAKDQCALLPTKAARFVEKTLAAACANGRQARARAQAGEAALRL